VLRKRLYHYYNLVRFGIIFALLNTYPSYEVPFEAYTKLLSRILFLALSTYSFVPPISAHLSTSSGRRVRLSIFVFVVDAIPSNYVARRSKGTRPTSSPKRKRRTRYWRLGRNFGPIRTPPQPGRLNERTRRRRSGISLARRPGLGRHSPDANNITVAVRAAKRPVRRTNIIINNVRDANTGGGITISTRW